MIYSESIRTLAERYFALAKATTDPQLRGRLLDYAASFAELSKQRQEDRSSAPEAVKANRPEDVLATDQRR